MKSNYEKIFTGNKLEAQKIVNKLHEIGIEPIVKDEAESARLAGFASLMLGEVEIYVNNDEVEKAMTLLNKK